MFELYGLLFMCLGAIGSGFTLGTKKIDSEAKSIVCMLFALLLVLGLVVYQL